MIRPRLFSFAIFAMFAAMAFFLRGEELIGVILLFAAGFGVSYVRKSFWIALLATAVILIAGMTSSWSVMTPFIGYVVGYLWRGGQKTDAPAPPPAAEATR